MTQGQKIALGRIQVSYNDYFLQGGRDNFEITRNCNYAAQYILSHPEYIDDNGNYLDEIAVDYKLGRINKPYLEV